MITHSLPVDTGFQHKGIIHGGDFEFNLDAYRGRCDRDNDLITGKRKLGCVRSLDGVQLGLPKVRHEA